MQDISQTIAAIRVELNAHLKAPKEESLVAVAAAHTRLRQMGDAAASDEHVECLLLVAQFFYLAGRTVLGLEPASNAVAYARLLSGKELLRKALTFHGVLLGDSGNLPAAIECQAEALDLAIETGSLAGEGSVWNNLGLALLYGAQFREAVQCFERVLAVAEVEPAFAPVRAAALGNIALACLQTEDFSRGLQASAAVVERLQMPQSANDLLMRVLAEATYSRLAVEVNDLETARKRCLLGKQFASQSNSARAEHAAALAEGLFEVYSGLVDVGLSRLQNALEQARIMKSALRDALIALVKAYDICGKPQMALVHLRELLHYTKKTQQEKALLHHRLHLKGLGAAWQSDQGSDPLAALQPEGVNRERIVAQWALLHRQAIAAELVEDPSGEHVYRVGRLAALLGAETGLDDDTCFMLELSARLHDIGKIGVPDAILAKRGSIDAEQQALVRTHVNIGAELLSQSGLDGIELAVDVTRHHHERWDGQGYPEGIAGGAIPEAARITALADVFDVMTHPRPYREALGIDEALAQIEKERGRRFDPELTDRFVAMIRRLRAEVGDLDEYLAQEARESPFIQARRKIAAALARAQAQGPLPRAAGGNSADAAADRV